MKILIADTNYPAFLRSFYANSPQLAQTSYAEQYSALMSQCFGTSDFYSSNLRDLGYEAQDIVVNCLSLQHAWARENAPRLSRGRGARWKAEVFAEQVRQIRPDVLYLQDITYFDGGLLGSLREDVRLLVGQTSYPLDWTYPLGVYDMIFSSFPYYIEEFRSRGLNAEYLRIAFEPNILEKIPLTSAELPVTFVGGFSPAHKSSLRAFEFLAERIPVDVWGYGFDLLPRSSPLRHRFHGEAWGIDMYCLLARSRITLNRHGDVAREYANNMRLYEATGVGSCLVTDMRKNLGQLFAVGTEVVAYESREDLVEKVAYLLEHEGNRKAIARAGQERTLREHAYSHRMQELGDILHRQLRASRVNRRPAVTRAQWPTRTPAARRLRVFIRDSPLGPMVKWALDRVRLRFPTGTPISVGHKAIAAEEVDRGLEVGWQSEEIPSRQRQLVDGELARMYRGDVAPVYRVAADAVRLTGLENPYIVEVGCASGYYGEVLSHLLRRPVQYLGLDYSSPLVSQGRHFYPQTPFVVGDATALPLRDDCCDILFSPAVLMHVIAYKKAIRESFRVSRAFCIFHRTPVFASHPTTYFSKMAYGVPVVELVFSETEILEIISQLGAEVVRVFSIDRAFIRGVDEPVEVKTYLCKKR